MSFLIMECRVISGRNENLSNLRAGFIYTALSQCQRALAEWERNDILGGQND